MPYHITDGANALTIHDERIEPIPIYDPVTNAYLGSVERPAFPTVLPANHPDPDSTVAEVQAARIEPTTGTVGINLRFNPYNLQTTLQAQVQAINNWQIVLTNQYQSLRMSTNAASTAITNLNAASQYVVSTPAWREWRDANTFDDWHVTADNVHTYWYPVNSSPSVYASPKLSAKELREIKKIQLERERAKKRAITLLRTNLSKEQWAEYKKSKRFHVVSESGKLFQIRHGRSRNIRLIEKGKSVAIYCIHPLENVPDEDTLLAQKLMLECDEKSFLKIANVDRSRDTLSYEAPLNIPQYALALAA